MNLVKNQRSKIKDQNIGKHAGHSTGMFIRKFWISLVLTIPIVLVELGVLPESKYVLLILGSAVFWYGGWVFLAGAYRELRARLPGMMTLIAVAIIAAYTFSVYQILTGQKHTLFWELATLITVMLLGHWLEMKAVASTRRALGELAKLLPDKAEVVIDGATKVVGLSELKLHDVVLVKPGGKIPTDGKIVEGSSELNESLLTGESKPVSKSPGDEVIAGTINGSGSLKIEVTKIGKETFLSGVMRLVSEAEASKSRLQMLSDRAAFYLTIVAISGGIATLAVWLFLADAPTAVERMVAVLVIACPHALGLAVPLVASISTNLAATNGFLIKRRLGLESARKVDAVLFDKTGTLTTGEFGVVEVLPDEQTLVLAASINSHSEHSIAKAVVAEARKRKLNLVEPKDFQALPGKGAKAMVGQEEVYSGSEVLLSELGISVPENLGMSGKTVIHIVKNNKYAGSIGLADGVREESRQAISQLKNAGIKVAMITGDSDDVAAAVSQELGIDEYFSRVLPGQKAEKIKLLQGRGLKVAMVGDGVNDAPALTQADVGIAVGAGTNVAIESADIILAKSDPRDIPKIIKLSKATYRKMIQNLIWATAYNVIALPLAAGVLASKGIILAPAVGAIFMSLSTVIVAVNAQFLRKLTL